jgi:hypothetical protein
MQQQAAGCALGGGCWWEAGPRPTQGLQDSNTPGEYMSLNLYLVGCLVGCLSCRLVSCGWWVSLMALCSRAAYACTQTTCQQTRNGIEISTCAGILNCSTLAD